MLEANCLICKAPLEYYPDARELTCALCGKIEVGHCACKEGHYVCDACHRSQGVDYIIGLCSDSDSANPVQIINKAMASDLIYPNGPEHHTLVGAALITAYCNAGGELDKAAALEEMRQRSLQLPGGTCGYWGVCSGATSAGQAMSIILGASPLTREPWALCQRLTSDILGKLADIGGPRCCKRSAYIAVLTAVDHIASATGVQMEKPERVKCGFFHRNAECLRTECPFFPVGE